MNPVYKKAIWIGIGLGLFALASSSVQEYGQTTYIPGWDYVGDNNFIDPAAPKHLRQGVVLDLQHQAVVLRFCDVFLNYGLVYVFSGIAVALFFAYLETFGEQHYVLTFRRSLKLGGLVMLIIWLALAIPVAIGNAMTVNFESSMLHLLNLFWINLPFGIVCIGLPIAFASMLVHLASDAFARLMAKSIKHVEKEGQLSPPL